MNNTNTVYVEFKHVDVSNNSCGVTPGTRVKEECGCIKLDRGKKRNR